MKLQQQLYTEHNPANGVYGDCYRTCIAILLNMDAADVPHFAAFEMRDGLTREETDGLVEDWLKDRGYVLLSMAFNASNPGTEHWLKKVTGNLPYILTGQSHRFPDTAHCVIAQGGSTVIHDPAINRARQIEPCYDSETGDYLWFIEIIVRAI